jgi:hypothetical protein
MINPINESSITKDENIFENVQFLNEEVRYKKKKKDIPDTFQKGGKRMTVEQFAIQQLNTLIPGYEKIELEMYIDDVSYSIDFLVTIDGQRKQCLDLIDEGTITNKAYEAVAQTIAKYARASEDYITGRVNKYKVTKFPQTSKR